MRFVINLPLTTLDKLEGRLFAEYQSSIFGSVSTVGSDGKEDYLSLTPRLDSSKQIWSVVSHPSIGIPPDHRIGNDCYFSTRFECTWDEEHGLSVLFNSKGEPIAIGGQGDHY